LNNDHLLFENSKIIGIYHNFDFLCSSLEEQNKLINKQFYRWTLFDQDEYQTKDLSKQSNDFLWYQLFHDVILHLSHDDFEELNLFEQNYQAKEALDYFIQNVFLNQLINEALQMKDIIENI
jgi:hypothetical protein